MNNETINELERLDKEQLDNVLDYAYLLDEHLYFKRETRKLSKEKKELIKYLKQQIENEKKVQKFLYENENTKLVEKAKVNSAIGTYQEILDKVRGDE